MFLLHFFLDIFFNLLYYLSANTIHLLLLLCYGYIFFYFLDSIFLLFYFITILNTFKFKKLNFCNGNIFSHKTGDIDIHLRQIQQGTESHVACYRNNYMFKAILSDCLTRDWSNSWKHIIGPQGTMSDLCVWANLKFIFSQ